MRSKSYLFLLLVLGLGLLSAFLYTQRPYKYGLDIKGGVRFTYRMDTSKLTPEQRANVGLVRERLLQILQNRATGSLGVSEPTVISKGDDQFVVELPGLSNIDEAKNVIGSSASIKFYWAKNIRTTKATYRQFTPIEDKGSPLVSFARTYGSSDVIKPGTPEYQRIIDGWELILSGDELKDAQPQAVGDHYEPLMNFSSSGAQKMERWSRKTENMGENLASVLDGQVLSIAPLRDNTILSDNAVTNGNFSAEYVKKLTNLLNAGALPVDLIPLSSEKVDATIGGEALNKIVVAGAISFGLISVFLIAYYGFPGVVAWLALMLYILFTITVLKTIGATFSLAAIAGFILSVGMAVDANILVFERFKEEMKLGKSLSSAIELGFRRALPAIMDSNACTVLTSLVLVNLGTGPVKGFATTLIIGVAISLFTAFMVTRSLLVFFVNSGIGANPKWYAINRNWFGERFEAKATTDPLQVVQKSKKWFMLSLATILISIPFFFLGGFKLNVEFRGGYESVYSLGKASTTGAEIASNLEKAGLKGGNVKIGTVANNERIAYVTLPPLKELEGSDQAAIQKIATAAGLDVAQNRGFTKIGPTVQQETLRNAVIGVTVSSALIVLYLAFRFGVGVGGFSAGLRFGVSAIGALLHDVFVVIGTAAIVGYVFQWEVGALFLTAMLTIIGFSVHDTIVIFDRIRENLRRVKAGDDFEHLVNRSISQSFARSINTSMTVIVTLLILVFAGTVTPDLKFFVTSMLIGILSGTYSSIYNASPILYLWDKAIGKSKGEEFTLIGMARNDGARIVLTHAQTETAQSTAPDGRTYGQVRRRANSAVKRSEIEIDDEP